MEYIKIHTRQRVGLFGVALALLLMLLLGGCRVERQTYEDLYNLMAQRFPENGPGVVLYVHNDVIGEQILPIGLGDMAQRQRILAMSHLRIGDMTRAFVSTLVFQLVEEGKVQLDDPLTAHFSPDITADLPYSDQITIRHLLNMSSGLYDYRDNPDLQAAIQAEPMAAWTPLQVLEYVYGQPAVFPPGTQYDESDTNYILLHILIEEKLEARLADALRDRILDQLVMDDTYLELSEDTAVGYVPGYIDANGDGLYEDTLSLPEVRGLGDLGLISNVLNLAEFAPALYTRTFTGENGRAESLATIPMGNGDEYGLGIMRRESPWGTLWGHENHSTPGFTGQMWYLPEYETTIVVLSNGLTNTDLTTLVNDVLDVVLTEE